MIHVYDQVNDVLQGIAEYIIKQSRIAIQRHGKFSLVLSGGSSPKRLHELLVSKQYRDQIEWNKVFFFFGDERYVPSTHSDSNYLMAKKTLFDPLNISAGQIFRMNTDLTPADCAQSYEKDILAYFSEKPVQFDLIILGLGDNSHTASLFPHTKVLYEKTALVKEEYIDEVKMYRITLTVPAINASHHIAFLVFGLGKAEAVKHIIEDNSNIEEYPAQLISPSYGELNWFIDQPAASKLTR
jgi:6-phosphogluconolactonase